MGVHKPGSVLCGHLSRPRFAPWLKRRFTRGERGPRSPLLFGLAPGGVYQASASRRIWWSLTPPFQLFRPALPPANQRSGRLGSFLFCGTFHAPPGRNPGRYPAPCPLEPGLSSCRTVSEEPVPQAATRHPSHCRPFAARLVCPRDGKRCLDRAALAGLPETGVCGAGEREDSNAVTLSLSKGVPVRAHRNGKGDGRCGIMEQLSLLKSLEGGHIRP